MSCQLAPTAHGCPPPASNRQPPALQTGALPPELDGHGVDLAGFEPAVFALPRRRATCCATGPWSGTPESNGVSCAPKAHGLPSPSCPIARRMVDAGLLMPSAVEMSTADPAGRSRGSTGGRSRTRYLRSSGDRRATCFALTHMYSYRCCGSRNAARSRCGRAASARRLRVR